MAAEPRPTPLLVLRSTVLLPSEVTSIEVTRAENRAALDACAGSGALLAAVPVAHRGQGLRPENLCEVAVACQLLERVELPDGGLRVSLRAGARARLARVEFAGGSFRAVLEPVGDGEPRDAAACAERWSALVDSVRRLEDAGDEIADLLALNAGDPEHRLHLAARLLGLSYGDRLALLRELSPARRLEALAAAVALQLRRGRARAASRRRGPRGSGGPAARPALDRVALADADPHEVEARALEERLAHARLPAPLHRRALRELYDFRRLRASSREAAAIRAYLEWVLELPFHAVPDGRGAKPDFESVEEVLGRSHAALRDVKDRVIEHLAVRLLAGRAQGTVLCFLGPPGTGKSSMGRAVAEALDREFVSIPIGAVTEEEQLRGYAHRQDGAQPGIILQSIQRAGSTDPVILIDEIDKLELGASGRAGGALLDLLDPEQNAEFLDHYLGLSYDLSRCIFLVTANEREAIPDAVLDRLEIIEFGGYTESEKLTIARGHLLEKARSTHGLEKRELRLSPAALLALVRHYTEEAGVRQLQRLLYSLARKAAVGVVRGGSGLAIKKGDLLELLGPAVVEEELHPRRPVVGVATGLAWTSAGGTLLPIEALAMGGAGRITLTGSIGEVMRESVQTAISFVRTCFGELGLQQGVLDELDLHLHFPSGSTPKDGPSAGVAVATALMSLMARSPVRHDVAMTGEVSLHGNVLAVGGLKDKLLAAIRHGIREVIVPERSREEVLRLPPEVRSKLTIHLIDHVREAFGLALLPRRPARPRTLVAEGDPERPRARRRTARPRKRSAGARRRRRGSKLDPDDL